MPDKQVIALSLCAESMGIDSENYFLYKLGTGCRDDFPPAHITRYNKRRKALAGKTSELDGYWFRAFVYENWGYYGSNVDLGWGAWGTLTGWI